MIQYIIGILLVTASCKGENKELLKENYKSNSRDIKMETISIRDNFINLIDTYKPDSTLQYEDSTGIETLKYLGSYMNTTGDKMSFVRIEKKVVVADGYKGKNLLAIIDNKQKGRYKLYDFDILENLPISLKGNNFMFSCNGIVYSGILNIEEELVCIESECSNECFIRQ